jgi:integrase
MAVKVESFQGRLRLRWSCQGERFSLSLGLDDTQLGRTIAQGRVSQIETDIITGKFDRTLAKYRTGVNTPDRTDNFLKIEAQLLTVRSRHAPRRSPSNFAYARSKCQKHLTEGAIALSEVTVLSPLGQVGSVLQDR